MQGRTKTLDRQTCLIYFYFLQKVGYNKLFAINDANNILEIAITYTFGLQKAILLDYINLCFSNPELKTSNMNMQQPIKFSTECRGFFLTCNGQTNSQWQVGVFLFFTAANISN
ncbi:hypothetical protein CHS0354_036427 [Potamilus streckersoni]|uniref:Uncharacterized protein n=1 Tax=Potamilus streckersoni TaxID=2493646 RepID=A0AAE0SXE6_9BIVA|nr:hypothetical protein CHS0354_036427 [Potamilus streckersoni]